MTFFLHRREGAKAVLLLCLFLFGGIGASAQTGKRVSLITCGPGLEFIGASFGHTAIRITDSARGTDAVYNYGTFDFGAPNFELRFAQGTLPYRLSSYPFASFLNEYAENGRSVTEQVMAFDSARAARLEDFLEENLLPQNREYIYSSVYDNCATRVRDALEAALGKDLRWGRAVPGKSGQTFRQSFMPHLATDPWQAFGIAVLSGRPVDQTMDNRQAMYLPRFLERATATASLAGKPLVVSTERLLPARVQLPPERRTGPAFWAVLGLAAVVCTLTILPAARKKVGLAPANALIFLSGLLGLLMLVMWLATDHRICRDNLNLLWALPTNVIAAWMPARKRTRYALIALLCILVVPALHAAGAQVFPLAQLWPLLLALAVSHGMVFRLGRVGTPAHHA